MHKCSPCASDVSLAVRMFVAIFRQHPTVHFRRRRWDFFFRGSRRNPNEARTEEDSGMLLKHRHYILRADPTATPHGEYTENIYKSYIYFMCRL